jgi:hypothetical protein
MLKTKTARRIVVIVDVSLQSQLIEKFLELGVTGYNCTECSGKGLHSVTGEPFTSRELVRIELITSDEVAATILDYIHAVQFQQFGRYPLAAYTDAVEVDVRDRSLTG